MNANPFLGVFFHWLGGLAAGSFYVPYRGVKKWAWEVYWLVGGFFSWIIAPWILASLNTRDLLGVLGQTSASTFAWTWFWGAMWGLGGLTFGLTMRYLGMSLGMAVALGYCAAFGTLMPPIFHGEFVSKVLGTTSGRFILLGVGVCLAGIAIAGWAGMSKERETTEDERRATIKEFNFGRGILVATFSGVMSACFAYALDAATPIAEASLARGTPPIWTGLPKLIVVLLGGFTSNFIWCAILNVRNRTTSQYFSSTLPARVPTRETETIIETAVDAPSEEVVEHLAAVDDVPTSGELLRLTVDFGESRVGTGPPPPSSPRRWSCSSTKARRIDPWRPAIGPMWGPRNRMRPWTRSATRTRKPRGSSWSCSGVPRRRRVCLSHSR